MFDLGCFQSRLAASHMKGVLRALVGCSLPGFGPLVSTATVRHPGRHRQPATFAGEETSPLGPVSGHDR